MKPSTLFAAGIVVCLALAGCANKEKQLEGKWKYKSVDLGANVPANLAETLGKLMDGMGLELKPEQKFVLTQPMGQPSLEGTWTLADKAVTLETKTVGGKSIDEAFKAIPAAQQQQAASAVKSMQATVGDDSKTMVLKMSAGGKTISITFAKEST